jgi:hypothetical protein
MKASGEISTMRQFLGHKSMVTVWLVLLFALWVVLTTALAVIARHGKSRKTLQPPVIVRMACSFPNYRASFLCRTARSLACLPSLLASTYSSSSWANSFASGQLRSLQRCTKTLPAIGLTG